MQGKLKIRLWILGALVMLIFVLLAFEIKRAVFPGGAVVASNAGGQGSGTNLVVGESEADESSSLNNSDDEKNSLTGTTTQTINLQGNRGKILDKNGQPLAYNVPSYNVQFIREDDQKRREAYRPLFTEVMIKTIKLIEQNGGKTIDVFPIKKDAEGTMYYDWGTDKKETAEKRFENWCNLMYVDKKASIEEAYNYLRNWLFIPENLPFEEAVKVLSIWQQVQLNSGRSYLPITVAENVSEETVAEIESRSNELEGMQTVRTTMRVYPRGELTAHLVGYTRKISGFENQEEIKAYTDEGYIYEDRVGVYGIEATQEKYLTGSTYEHQGKRVVEVTRGGQITRALEYQAPSDGADVITAIDLDLQQVAENGLKKNIEQNVREAKARIYNPQYMDKYLELLQKQGRPASLEEIKVAQEGSVVVVDVKNGNLLALANVPSFDNNDFIRGMTSAEYKEKYAKEDSTSYPLINRAISSRKAPGSIFKMAVGWAGLAENVVTVDTKISDQGAYSVSTDPVTKEPTFVGAPHCWINQSKLWMHADQDIVKALTNSCNYYFFTVADRLRIDRLNYWVEKLGLNNKTNVELTSEVAGQIGGQKVLFDNEKPINMNLVPGLIYRRISQVLKEYCEEINLQYEDEQISECATELLKLADDKRADDEYGEAIRQIMQEKLGIPQLVSSSRRWSYEISSYLTELVWNRSYTVRTGIGQGVVEITTIEAARYLAALVNGGTVYDVSVIDRVIDREGKTLYKSEPTVFGSMDEDGNLNLHLAKIKEGMEKVFSEEDGGSAGARFENFPYDIGGKTGTAQITRSNNIDIENTAWMVVFAPYDDPEIAIAVSISNGYAGAWCDVVVKDIVKYYMDRKNAEVKSNVNEINGLLN